jgi:hypothetical protein
VKTLCRTLGRTLNRRICLSTKCAMKQISDLTITEESRHSWLTTTYTECAWKYELDGSPFFQQTGKMDSHLMALRAATDNMLREALVERTYNMLVNFPGLRVRRRPQNPEYRAALFSPIPDPSPLIPLPIGWGEGISFSTPSPPSDGGEGLRVRRF